MSKKIYFLLLLFVLSFSTRLNAQEVFIPKGAEWKYLDDGSDQGTAWQELDFDDSGWASGPAQLGYGDGDEATVVSYGPSSSNKYITTYFRHSFELSDISDLNALLVKLLRDDGAVVYLNGTEIVRSNMPSGTITYTTKAPSFVAGSDEDNFYEFYADQSLLRIGENVVAVEIHQQSGSSSDISFDMELSTTTTSPLITRKAPYLIYTGSNTEYQLLWQLRETEDCTLEWGTDTSYSDGTVTTTEYGDDHQHSYTFAGLTPHTKYYYKVTIDTLVYTGSFVTAPEDSADAIKILVYGDNRSYPEDHDAVAEQIVNLFTDEPEYQSIIMNVGDMVANGDGEEDWDNQFFDPQFENIQKMLGSMGMQVTRGNHEGTGELLNKYFPYPLVRNHYWSFNYGPVHVAIIDQYVPYGNGSTQYNWLEGDLKRSNKQWKFIILHSPGWSAGGHGNSTDVQDEIQPLCVQNNVQIVFGGHNHYYARAVVEGVTHITTGGGGAPLYDPDPSYPNIVQVSKSHHFCKIDINGGELDFKAINSSGDEIDAFVLSTTGINDDSDEQNPTEFSLKQNYPNPFSKGAYGKTSTTISYSIPDNQTNSRMVTLTVYDALGREVATLVNEEQSPGNYTVELNASELTSGIYFYRLLSGNLVETKKMVLLK